MKKTFLLLLVLTCASVVRAQATGAQAPPPAGKIAVIYSEAFQDPKDGIAKFIATINKLNAEFKTVQDDLTQTATRLRTMQDEINRMQQGNPAATPQQIQAKVDQFDDQKKAYDRKVEDAKANFARRRAELLTPLQDDVGKALDAFGKAHGITMILDGSQLQQILIYASDGLDVTKAFIAEYNSKNPATTTAATPRP
jgi:Skp family chaperone for outer membrane proteins